MHSQTINKFSAFAILNKIPWSLVIMACLTIGLAPFAPPHFVEKLQMLWRGTLSKPVDWFDLIMHGTPWFILVLKSSYVMFEKIKSKTSKRQDGQPIV